jgi:hypothetical protein
MELPPQNIENTTTKKITAKEYKRKDRKLVIYSSPDDPKF